MTRADTFIIFLLVLTIASPVVSSAMDVDEFSMQPPPCRSTTAKRPKLPVNFEHDVPTEINADINGDGWCDYALGVAYPFNSKMNSYSLDELMVLGGRSGWKPILHGKKWYRLESEVLDDDDWPLYRVDMSDTYFVYPLEKGAPYIVGIFAGGNDSKVGLTSDSVCDQSPSVHRWDDKLGTLKKATGPAQKSVLAFFYSKMEPRCAVVPTP